MKGFETMNEVKYLSASELLEKARDVMVPIPSQLDAQHQIATLIAMFLNNVKSIEQGIPASQLPHVSAFIIGSTGSGKSYICKSLSGVCNIPFERVDSSSITQSGVRGKNLANVFTSILEKNPAFFQEPGIIVFDEFDKTFYTGNPEHDAYNPMRDFLALFETGEYTFFNDKRDNVTINLDKTLFLFAGACAKLPKLLEEKHKPKSRCLGFGSQFESSEENNVDLMSTATMEDIAEYGCMSELCSRLQTLIYIPDIDIQGYKQLITDEAKTSAYNKYKNCFKTRGVKLKIKDSAVELIAQQCIKQKLGARSIEAIINKALLKANNFIDDNAEYNKVVLYAKDDEFEINYFKGKRKVPDVKSNLTPDIDFEKINLSEDFETQHKIDIYCFRVTSNAEFKNSSQKELFHSFLQATCFYLANATRKTERTYANLIKLAEATSIPPYEFNTRSPFDIICSDYLKKNCNDENVEQNFLPYYMYFRNNSQDVNVSMFLVNALHTAAKNIYQKQEITAA